MPHAHRAQAEWTPSRLINWAETTGPATTALVAALLASKPHPEQGYRACLGLMRLSKTYGAARMDAACVRALHLGAPRYRTVQNILASGADRIALPDASAPAPRLPMSDARARNADLNEVTGFGSMGFGASRSLLITPSFSPPPARA